MLHSRVISDFVLVVSGSNPYRYQDVGKKSSPYESSVEITNRPSTYAERSVYVLTDITFDSAQDYPLICDMRPNVERSGI